MFQEKDEIAKEQSVSGFQRFIAFLLFFCVSVPLILFVLAIAYQLWELAQGRGMIVDNWTFFSILPLGLMISPVLFYLGWYLQARAKNQYFDLKKAMYGHFPNFCRALYGVLAGITILLAMIGVLGSAFIDSSLLLVSWLGIAFVGIGIVTWLFQDTDETSRSLEIQNISLKPTGIVFILFSLVWLYTGILAIVQQNQERLEGSAVLFLVFLVIGIIAIRLSERRSPAQTRDDNNLAE